MTDPNNDDSSSLPVARRNLRCANDIPFYKFVLTGGPCGGKTTAMARLFSYLRERNFQIISVPEAWGILNSHGLTLDFFSTDGMGEIVQGSVLNVQKSLEDSCERVLRATGQPAIVLCDRGLMDGAVYVSDAEFQNIIDEHNESIVNVRDNRYDAVFHLVTAADGAEDFYTLENNQVRTESIPEAIQVDRRTQEVWLGHPHLYVLDNSTDFEGKLSRLVEIVNAIVGLPSHLRRRSIKFLLQDIPDTSVFPMEYQIFEVEKVYLQQPQSESPDTSYAFIRRRTSLHKGNGQKLGSVYQITHVKKVADGEMVEQKRIITEREYTENYRSRDRRRHIVRQRRISFLYEKQSFNIHIYEAPIDHVCILHAQVQGESVVLPPFLTIDRRLTPDDDGIYGAYHISLVKES